MATFTGADKAISFLFDMVSNIANDYDETATYSVNDYAVHEGVLYKCTSAISIAETFTPAHWTAVLIMNEVSAGGGGGSSTLAGLSDVALASVANGDVLAFDSAMNKWKNAASSGGGSIAAYHGNWVATSSNVTGKELTDAVQVSAGRYLVVAHTPVSSPVSISDPFAFQLSIGGVPDDTTCAVVNKMYGRATFYVEVNNTTTIAFCTAQSAYVAWDSSTFNLGGIDILKVG